MKTIRQILEAYRSNDNNYTIEEAEKELLDLFSVRLSLPTDEEIKQKAFDFSYVFRDDEDFRRSDAVETYCEEMGYWVKNYHSIPAIEEQSEQLHFNSAIVAYYTQKDIK